MADRELVLRPHVEHGNEPILEAAGKLPARHRLKRIALLEVAADHLANFGQIPLGDAPKRRRQIENRGVAQTIEDALAVAARGEQAGPAHQPQVLRDVGDGESGTFGERLDAALALRRQLEHLEPMTMTERLMSEHRQENARRTELRHGRPRRRRAFRAKFTKGFRRPWTNRP